jgi:hypothetical protein
MDRCWRMRRRAVLVMAAALAGGLAPGCTNPARSGTIRALSYNVAGLPEGISGSHPAVNTPLISPKLNAYDLVAVQEDWVDFDPPVPGFDFHHDDLIAAADHPYKSVPAPPAYGRDPRRPSAATADGLNLLSRYRLSDSVHTMWNGCFGGADTADGGAADCLALKGFTFTRATLADGVEVDVYDLHGEAGGTAEDQRLQTEDFRQLAAFLATFSAGHAVILTGDTNLHTDGRHPDASGTADREIWRAFLTATGLADVCDTLSCGPDGDAIDKLALRSSPALTLTARSHQFAPEFVDAAGAPLSDHRALAVTIDWQALP